MIDFEKAEINALGENLFQNIFRRVQGQGLTVQYHEDNVFAISTCIVMFASLAFDPEIDVIDCSLI